MEPLTHEEQTVEMEERASEARLSATVEYPIYAKDLLMQTIFGIQRCAFCGNQEPLEYFETGASCVHEEMLLRCMTCQSTTYCSKVCQKNDWESHKELCANLCDKRATFKNDKFLMRQYASRDDTPVHISPCLKQFITKTFSSQHHAVSFLKRISPSSNPNLKENISFFVSVMVQYMNVPDIQLYSVISLGEILQPYSKVLLSTMGTVSSEVIQSTPDDLLDSKRVLLAIQELGLIEVLAQSMHLHKSNLFYQQAVYHLLRAIVLTPENAISAGKAGVFEALIYSVKRYSEDVTHVGSALATILYLCQNLHENRIIFGGLNGTRIINRIVIQHSTCKDILLQSLSALMSGYKIRTDCSIKAAFSVIKAMKNFENSPEVLSSGCRALMNLLRFVVVDDAKPLSSRIIFLAVKTIATCLEKFPVNVTLQKDVCRFLIIMLLDAGVYKILIDIGGVVNVVVNAICRIYNEFRICDPQFMLWGLKLLQRLSYDPLILLELSSRSDLRVMLSELHQVSSKTRVRRFVARLMKRIDF
jgi:hypothetical protein